MTTEGRVPIVTKALYSLGQSGESIKNVGLGMVLVYYNQALDVRATVVSLALGIAVVWDAFMDPSVGSWSDGMQSRRWGRRHLSMLLAIGPLAVCYFFLLWPPAGLGTFSMFLWLTFFSVTSRTALSFFHVPFLSLGAELSQDYGERTRIVSIRTFVGIASSLLVVGVTWGYFFKGSHGVTAPQLVRANYFDFALFGAVTMAILLIISTLGTLHTIPRLAGSSQQGRKFGVKRVFLDLFEALRNSSYRALFVGTLIFSIYSGFRRSMGVHLQTFFWHLHPWGIRDIQQSLLVGGMVGVFFTPLFTRTFDKKWTVIIGVLGSAFLGIGPVLLRTLGVFPFEGRTLVWTLAALEFCTAFMGMQALVSVQSMMGDIADEHELRHGRRQEGIYFGSHSFSGKVTSGLSIVFAGLAIDLIGLKPGSNPATVPHHVLMNFGLVYSSAALLLIFSTWVFLPYSLGSKQHAEVIAALRERRAQAGGAAGTTEGLPARAAAPDTDKGA